MFDHRYPRRGWWPVRRLCGAVNGPDTCAEPKGHKGAHLSAPNENGMACGWWDTLDEYEAAMEAGVCCGGIEPELGAVDLSSVLAVTIIFLFVAYLLHAAGVL